MGSLARTSSDANLDAPRRDLRVLLAAHEVDLGRADIGVPGKFPHLVHGGPVPDNVVDGGLAQRVNANTAAPQPRGIDAGRLTILLHEPPGGFAVQVLA